MVSSERKLSGLTWGKLAEVCNQYLTKGKQVYVEGRLKSRTYQAQSGEMRVALDVSVNEVQFLGGGQGQEPVAVGQDNDDLSF